MPVEMIDALDAHAARQRTTRSALVRGIVEDVLDELPSMPVVPTRQEQLDAELAWLRSVAEGVDTNVAPEAI
jgi:hypothetical protein